MAVHRKKLKILFISQYFPPEVAAPAVRVYETCREWAELGHEVTVLCGFPHHPTGIIPERYKGFIVKRETRDGIKILRTWLHAAPNKGVFRRSASYFSFMVSAIVSGLLFIRKPDIILSTSPQMLTGVAGYILSKIKKCPFVFEVRDLWPDALKAVGVNIPKPVFNLLKALELFLYKKAKRIIVVTRSFKDTLAENSEIAEKISVIPNGVDLDTFHPGNKRGGGIAYIGTLGLAQKLDFLITTAAEMPDVAFTLAGDGADRERLERYSRELKAANVNFSGLLPRKDIPGLLRKMDICVVALRNTPIFKKFIPSKMFEIMACGCPVVVACEGEAAYIAEKSGGAIVVPPENTNALKAALHKLLENRKLRDNMGKKGRLFVENEFDRKKLSLEYAGVLQSIFP